MPCGGCDHSATTKKVEVRKAIDYFTVDASRMAYAQYAAAAYRSAPASWNLPAASSPAYASRSPACGGRSPASRPSCPSVPSTYLRPPPGSTSGSANPSSVAHLAPPFAERVCALPDPQLCGALPEPREPTRQTLIWLFADV